MNATSTFTSEGAKRHMTALCHHFGRKVEVHCEDDFGSVQFPFGRCEMSVADGQLVMTATAQDQPNLDTVIQIVTSHLERFAFRECPELRWHTATEAAA